MADGTVPQSTSAQVDDILSTQAALEQRRVNFNTTWQRIAELIDPQNALFLNASPYPGERRDQFQFDSTGQKAAYRGAVAMESVLTPQTQSWHALEPLDEGLRKNKRVMAWCESRTRALFRARYVPMAGFVPASSGHFQSLFAYGNGCTFVDDIVGKTIRYRSEFIGDVWIAQDETGLTDRAHRRLALTKAQAIGKFGERNLPAKVTECTDQTRLFEFLHAVYRNHRDYDPRRRDYRGMTFRSCYVLRESGSEVIEEGGYRTMPYLYSMFSTVPRETYGRGPASFVLNTLNTINEQQKTILRAGQRAVDPPLLLPDDDILQEFDLRSGALNYGGMDSMGNERVKPLLLGANMPLGLEMVEQSRLEINDAFFVNLFMILVENPRMTATEALLRAQEKGQLLGPPMGRQQQTYLSPLIERELDILSQVPGFTDDMPPELEEAGGLLNVRYTAPLQQMQVAGHAAGLMASFEQLSVWEQSTPGIISRTFNPERVADILVEANGVPVRALLTEDERAAQDAQAAEQAQTAMLLEAAPVAGKTALDLAKAQQIASAQPTASLLGG